MLKYFWAAERAINKLIAYPKPFLSLCTVWKSIFEYWVTLCKSIREVLLEKKSWGNEKKKINQKHITECTFWCFSHPTWLVLFWYSQIWIKGSFHRNVCGLRSLLLSPRVLLIMEEWIQNYYNLLLRNYFRSPTMQLEVVQGFFLLWFCTFMKH